MCGLVRFVEISKGIIETVRILLGVFMHLLMNLGTDSCMLTHSLDLSLTSRFVCWRGGAAELAGAGAYFIQLPCEVLPFFFEVAEFVGVELEAGSVVEGFLLLGLFLYLAAVFAELAFVGAGGATVVGVLGP